MLTVFMTCNEPHYPSQRGKGPGACRQRGCAQYFAWEVEEVEVIVRLRRTWLWARMIWKTRKTQINLNVLLMCC